jgi:hypothetical protein
MIEAARGAKNLYAPREKAALMLPFMKIDRRTLTAGNEKANFEVT